MFPRFILAIGLCAAILASAASAGDVGVRLKMLGGGSLSVTYDPTAGTAASLDGRDQQLTYELPLTVIDSRSNGAGWNLTVTSTAFDNGAAKALAPNAASITSARVACLGGCTEPKNLIEYPVPMPASADEPAPIKIFDAGWASGMGAFSVVPTVAVSVPGDTYAGNYVSTVAVAIVSGP